ncbi:peptidylprolyl isomerase [Pseudoalteromonas sp. T1lg65]|uniref:peptidylprolyl isomerase n=1 Tax=Pseudoalteromonas sp. T1lg65 TaxID=2077101 RepID=UPI003F79B006
MKIIKTMALSSMLVGAMQTHATIVEFQTTKGSFQVNLYDQSTPKTVENFLKYVNSERYNDTLVHRAIPDFVVQGGGFNYDATDIFAGITIDKSVINEPKWSNVRGTIAMAKPENNANGATSQWFFNLTDNSKNLDTQNGGYAVFGEVVGEGMSVIDDIAEVPRCGTIPLQNYTEAQCKDSESKPAYENFIKVTAVIVVDDDPNSAQALNPMPNTLIKKQPEVSESDSSSGSFSALLMLLAGAAGFRRRNTYSH